MRFQFRFTAIALPFLVAALSAHGACQPLASVPETVSSARVVVFGELHGTKESPDFVARFLCSATKAGTPVVLALEIPVEEQPRIDSFMESDGRGRAWGELLTGSFWNREHHDGRSSVAMASLIRSARDLRANGSAVAVLAIAKYDSGRGDSAMADVVTSVLASNSSLRAIVLTGSVHGSNSAGAAGNPTFAPLGSLLAERYGALTFQMSSGGGSFWACVAGRCDAHVRLGGVEASRKQFELILETGVAGYDGTYFVGKMSASPPISGGPSSYSRPDG